MCVYGTCLFYVCCSDCVGGVYCVAALFEDSIFLALGCLKLYLIYVCIVRRVSVGACVWEV